MKNTKIPREIACSPCQIRYWLQKYVGSILVMILIPIWTVLISLVALMYAAMFSGRKIHKFANYWGFIIVKFSGIFMNLNVKYIGKIPPAGSIIAAQHQSALDVFALIAVAKNPIFILKKILAQMPIFGWIILWLGMIPVDRSKFNRNWVDDAKKQLELGRSLIIFPEGTRVPFGEEIPYKSGAFRLSQTLNKPIFPVALDTGLFWKRNAFFKEPGTTFVIFGLEYENPTKEGLREKFAELLKSRPF